VIHDKYGFDWTADEKTYFQVDDYVEKCSYRMDLTEEQREVFNELDPTERFNLLLMIHEETIDIE
jgi:hypothetical protein